MTGSNSPIDRTTSAQDATDATRSNVRPDPGQLTVSPVAFSNAVVATASVPPSPGATASQNLLTFLTLHPDGGEQPIVTYPPGNAVFVREAGSRPLVRQGTREFAFSSQVAGEIRNMGYPQRPQRRDSRPPSASSTRRPSNPWRPTFAPRGSQTQPRLISFPDHSQPTPERIASGGRFYLPNQAATARYCGGANICGPLALCAAAGFPLTSWHAFTGYIAASFPNEMAGLAAGATDDQLFRFGRNVLQLRDIEMLTLYADPATCIRRTADGFQIPNATLDHFMDRVGQRFVLVEANHWTSYRQYEEGGWCRLDGLGEVTDIDNDAALRQDIQQRLARQTRSGHGNGLSLIWWHQQPSPASLVAGAMQHGGISGMRGDMAMENPGMPPEIMNVIASLASDEAIVAAMLQSDANSSTPQRELVQARVQQLEGNPAALTSFLRAYPDTCVPQRGNGIHGHPHDAGLIPSRSDLIFTAAGIPRSHPAYSRHLISLASTRSHDVAQAALRWLRARLGSSANAQYRKTMLGMYETRVQQQPPGEQAAMRAHYQNAVLLDAASRLVDALPHLVLLDLRHIRLESTFAQPAPDEDDATRAGWHALFKEGMANPDDLFLHRSALDLVCAEIDAKTFTAAHGGARIALSLARGAAALVAFRTDRNMSTLLRPDNHPDCVTSIQAWRRMLDAALGILEFRDEMPAGLDSPGDQVAVLVELARAMPAACQLGDSLTDDEAEESTPASASESGGTQDVEFNRIVARYIDCVETIAETFPLALRIDLLAGWVDALNSGGYASNATGIWSLVDPELDSIHASGDLDAIERTMGIVLQGLLSPMANEYAIALTDRMLDWAFPDEDNNGFPVPDPSMSDALLLNVVATTMLRMQRDELLPYWQVVASASGGPGNGEMSRALASIVENADPVFLEQAFGRNAGPGAAELLRQVARGMAHPDLRHDRILTRLLAGVSRYPTIGVEDTQDQARRYILAMALRTFNAMYAPDPAPGESRLPPLGHQEAAQMAGVLIARAGGAEIDAGAMLGLLSQLDSFALAVALTGVAERVSLCMHNDADFCQRALSSNLGRVPSNASIPVLAELANSLARSSAGPQRHGFLHTLLEGMRRLVADGFSEAREEIRQNFRVGLAALDLESSVTALEHLQFFGQRIYLFPDDMQRDWFEVTAEVSRPFCRVYATIRDSMWQANDQQSIGLQLAGYLHNVEDNAERDALLQTLPPSLAAIVGANAAPMARIAAVCLQISNPDAPIQAMQLALRHVSNLVASSPTVAPLAWNALRSQLMSVGPSTLERVATGVGMLASNLDMLPAELRAIWFDATVNLLQALPVPGAAPGVPGQEQLDLLADAMATHLRALPDEHLRYTLFLTIPSPWQGRVRELMDGGR